MEELAKKEEEGKLAFAQSFINEVKQDKRDIERLFFIIGFRLNEAAERGYAAALGYKDILELAEAEFDIGRIMAYSLMKINRTYSDHYANGLGVWLPYSMKIAKEYDGYSQTQLENMLSLDPAEREKVPKSFKTRQIKDYKKLLDDPGLIGLDTHYGKSYYEVRDNPESAVNKYRELLAAGKTEQPKNREKQAEPELVADRQMVLTDAGEVEEYHQSGGDGFVRSTGQTVQEAAQAKLDEIMETADDGDVAEVFDPKRYILSKEDFAEQTAQFTAESKEPTPPKPARHNFKNNEERKAFINNPANYPVLVLRNEELNLTVKRCDLANGAKIYRTEYKEYSDYHKKTFEHVRLCLIDVQEAAEQTGHNASGTFSPKTYTIDGTAPTYIVEYMTKFKNEI